MQSSMTRYGSPRRLEDVLGVAHELFVLVVRLLGLDELDHLDLVELVHAHEAARVLAVRAGLAPEAGRVGGELDRQVDWLRISSR